MGFLTKQIEAKFSYLKNHRVLFLFIPILFGFWSYLLGQDRNSDLFNYHLYNAFAFLNKKDYLEFGVAGLQGFFNPILDVPYYLLLKNIDPKFIAFLMGIINGMIFIPIFYISRIYLGNTSKNNIYILIALSGCLTPNFLAGLGNSMGDNITALLNLLSLLLVSQIWNKSKKFILIFVAIGGLIAGFSTGLKLTNAFFPLALAITLMLASPRLKNTNIRITMIYSIFVLFGILITAGFWHYELWKKFGNPFFPLLSNIFQNEYFSTNVFNNKTTSTFGPGDLVEFLLWPFISSIDYHRAGRGLIHQIIWPVIYMLLIFIAYKKISNISIKKKEYDFKQNFIILFISFAYLLQILIFPIQRYGVSIEVLTPLIIYILLKKINAHLAWQRWKKISIVSLLIILLGGFGTWGHTSFTSPIIKVETPKFTNPKSTIILMPDPYIPLSWMVDQFDRDITFIKIGVVPAIDNKLISLIGNNKSENYVIFNSFHQWRKQNIEDWNRFLYVFGMLRNKKRCETLNRFITKVNFRGQITYLPFKESLCSLSLKPLDNPNLYSINNEIINKHSDLLKSKGLSLDKNSCLMKDASLGRKKMPYIICKIQMVPKK